MQDAHPTTVATATWVTPSDEGATCLHRGKCTANFARAVQVSLRGLSVVVFGYSSVVAHLSIDLRNKAGDWFKPLRAMFSIQSGFFVMNVFRLV